MISCDGVRWIIGAGTYLDIAFHAWQQALPHEDIRRVDVTQNADYSFNTEIFSQTDPNVDLVFIAFNEKFGNFKRSELMQAALACGSKLDSFISPKALLSANVSVGVNCFVADGVIVGANTKIDYNTVLLSGSVVGFNVRIKPSCWIESGVQLGEGVTVGSHAIIRTGAVVAPGVALGRFAEIAIPGRYGNDVPAKAVFDPRFNTPIFVYGT
jgi:acetyltransferase-like isoleucine patch superfamily enzyme